MLVRLAWCLAAQYIALTPALSAQERGGESVRALSRSGVSMRLLGKAIALGRSWQLYAVSGGLLAIDAGGVVAPAATWSAIGASRACGEAARRVVTPELLAATSQAVDVGAIAGQVSVRAAPALAAVNATNAAVTSVTNAAAIGVGRSLRAQGGALGILGDIVSGAGAQAGEGAHAAIARATGVDLREVEAALAVVVNEGGAVARDAATMQTSVARLREAMAGGTDPVGACSQLGPLAGAASTFSARLEPLVARIAQARSAADAVASVVPSQPAREIVTLVDQVGQRVAGVRAPFERAALSARAAAAEFERERTITAQELAAGSSGAVRQAISWHEAALAGFVRLAATPAIRSNIPSTNHVGSTLARARLVGTSDPTSSLRMMDGAFLAARDGLRARPEVWPRALMREASIRDQRQWLGLPRTRAIWSAARVAHMSLLANDLDRALLAIQLGVDSAKDFDARVPRARAGIIFVATAILALLVWIVLRGSRPTSLAGRVPSGLFALVIVAPSVWSESSMQGSRPLVMIVNSSGLHVRSQPSYDAPRSALLPKGARVCVIRGVGKDWYEVVVRVRRQVLRGYVARGFLVDSPTPIPSDEVQSLCSARRS